MSEIVGSCVNCLSRDVHPTKGLLKQKPNVKVQEALGLIYGITLSIHPDVELLLCKNCNEILFQLHHIFNHFRDLSRANSVIGLAHKQVRVDTSSSQSPLLPTGTSGYKVETRDVACQYEDQMFTTLLYESVENAEDQQLFGDYLEVDHMDLMPIIIPTEIKLEPSDETTVIFEDFVVPNEIFEGEHEAPKPPPPVTWGAQVMRKRGRPCGSKNKFPKLEKVFQYSKTEVMDSSTDTVAVKRPRGRPKKLKVDNSLSPPVSNVFKEETPSDGGEYRRRVQAPVRYNDMMELEQEDSEEDEGRKMADSIFTSRVEDIQPKLEFAPTTQKRKRGRPRKHSLDVPRIQKSGSHYERENDATSNGNSYSLHEYIRRRRQKMKMEKEDLRAAGRPRPMTINSDGVSPDLLARGSTSSVSLQVHPAHYNTKGVKRKEREKGTGHSKRTTNGHDGLPKRRLGRPPGSPNVKTILNGNRTIPKKFKSQQDDTLSDQQRMARRMMQLLIRKDL